MAAGYFNRFYAKYVFLRRRHSRLLVHFQMCTADVSLKSELDLHPNKLLLSLYYLSFIHCSALLLNADSILTDKVFILLNVDLFYICLKSVSTKARHHFLLQKLTSRITCNMNKDRLLDLKLMCD